MINEDTRVICQGITGKQVSVLSQSIALPSISGPSLPSFSTFV